MNLEEHDRYYVRRAASRIEAARANALDALGFLTQVKGLSKRAMYMAATIDRAMPLLNGAIQLTTIDDQTLAKAEAESNKMKGGANVTTKPIETKTNPRPTTTA